MAKRRRKVSKSETDVDDASEVSSRGKSVPIGRALLGQSMGITNLGRTFVSAQRFNTPQILYRIYQSAFPHGFSDSAGPSSQDPQAALAYPADPSDELFPITPMAEAFFNEYWPILNSLLQSGTGTRYTTTVHEVVRYYSHVIRTLELIAFPLNLNYLTTQFDWTSVAPHTTSVPPSVWGTTQLFNANDVGVADIWKPLYSRLATKVLPPDIVASCLEKSMPYIGNPWSHCLRLNCHSITAAALTGWDISAYVQDITNRLDYLEDVMSTTHNVLASFLPFRVGNIMSMFKGYDPMYEEIDYNSGLTTFDNFGDTGDPVNHQVLTCGTESENGDSIIFFHRGDAPTVKSVVSTPCFDLIYHLTDDTFINLSVYLGGTCYAIDDDLALIAYDGSDSVSTAAQRYRRYFPNRYQKNAGSTDLSEGVGATGFLPAIIAREEYIRATKAYSKFLFGVDPLKQVLAITGGSSVRTIQQGVAETWLKSKQ
jgi:hypothetical protein